MQYFKLMRIICIMLSLFFIITHTYGENNIMPLEQLQSNNTFILDIKEKLLSTDYYSQSIAINLMEKIINTRSFPPIKDELICILHHLCTYNDYIDTDATNLCLKKKGIELTGRLGAKTRNTEFAYTLEDILIEQLQIEKDITIVSSTIFALGIIGGNKEGKTIKAIASATDTWTKKGRNQDFNLAVITSIEKIAQTNNGIKEQEAYTTIIKIMQSSNDALIIEKSFEVIEILNSL